MCCGVVLLRCGNPRQRGSEYECVDVIRLLSECGSLTIFACVDISLDGRSVFLSFSLAFFVVPRLVSALRACGPCLLSN